MDGFGVHDKPCLDLKISVTFNLVIPKLSDLMGYLIVAAGSTVKNRVAVESRRPRLLY
jgi:hypothetical protein